jgi:death-on-curing protein
MPSPVHLIQCLQHTAPTAPDSFARGSYEQAELPELAAAYGYGIARNHPFIDGNKRTALLAIYTFLGVNDVDFVVPEADAATMILALAAGEVSEDNLARWIRDNWPKA